jgi:hypothetical protein
MAQRISIEVCTDEFRRSHLAEPRGRGGWLWLFDGQTDVQRAVCFQGTFTESRRAAVAHAREHGFRLARVLP